MSDMTGPISSNAFRVKDIAAFKAWFKPYYFSDGVELSIDDSQGYISFGSTCEYYPSAYPRLRDAGGDMTDADLELFARGLCAHLKEGEIFNVVAGGNEKLRYVSFSQLVIAQGFPDKPYYYSACSDADEAELLGLVGGRQLSDT